MGTIGILVWGIIKVSSDNRSNTNHELNHRRRQHLRHLPSTPWGPNLQPKITPFPPRRVGGGGGGFLSWIWPLKVTVERQILILEGSPHCLVDIHPLARSPALQLFGVWSGHHRPDLPWLCSNTVLFFFSKGNNIRWVEVLVQLNTTLQSAWHVGSFPCAFYLDAAVCAVQLKQRKRQHTVGRALKLDKKKKKKEKEKQKETKCLRLDF